MLFYITSRIVSSIVAFLYPGYASYKTLSQRPASEEELERWLMYWSVLGCIVGMEYVAEWLVSWIPFYYTIKTTFLLYLALPQTRGSSYLYVNHLRPFFHSHETQIDAALASFKAKLYSFIQERLRALWDQTAGAVSQQQNSLNPVGGGMNAGPPPTLNDPVSGPAQLISSFWQSYGPGIIASGTAILRQTAASANAPTGNRSTLNSSPPSYIGAETTQSVLERRRQLEAELAALPEDMSAPVPALMPRASLSLQPSRGSETSLRERTYSGSGKFEEVEVPSDVEGYEVDDEGNTGYESGRPGSQKKGSWFGWSGGSSASRDGYERVKSE